MYYLPPHKLFVPVKNFFRSQCWLSKYRDQFFYRPIKMSDIPWMVLIGRKTDQPLISWGTFHSNLCELVMKRCLGNFLPVIWKCEIRPTLKRCFFVNLRLATCQNALPNLVRDQNLRRFYFLTTTHNFTSFFVFYPFSPLLP